MCVFIIDGTDGRDIVCHQFINIYGDTCCFIVNYFPNRSNRFTSVVKCNTVHDMNAKNDW